MIQSPHLAGHFGTLNMRALDSLHYGRASGIVLLKSENRIAGEPMPSAGIRRWNEIGDR